MPAVLKTAVLKGAVGWNPTLSASLIRGTNQMYSLSAGISSVRLSPYGTALEAVLE